jgi:subtilisin family serine protease
MLPLDLVKLAPLMAITRGRSDVHIGLIDGPVLVDHIDLSDARIRQIGGSAAAACSMSSSAACLHGTFVAGILSASRHSTAPAICPGCTLLVRPIFVETASPKATPAATPTELAAAIIDCVDAGAHVINLSLGLAQLSSNEERSLDEALNHALKRGVFVVAAAGNQATLGSSPITRHPWVISVTSCDLQGRPTNESTIGRSIGRRGLSAPGDGITSLGSQGQPLTLGGSSVAVPFVTGTIALLCSLFPQLSAARIRFAITHSTKPRRTSVVPPLLDAAAAFQFLSRTTTARAA